MIVWVIRILCIGSMVSNLISLVYIKKKIMAKTSILILLILDSSTSLCFSIIMFINSLLNYGDLWACVTMGVAATAPSAIGNTLMAGIAMIR